MAILSIPLMKEAMLSKQYQKLHEELKKVGEDSRKLAGALAPAYWQGMDEKNDAITINVMAKVYAPCLHS